MGEAKFGSSAWFAALALCATAIAVLVLWTATKNSEARSAEAAQIAGIERAMLAAARSDAAVVHLDNRFDPNWADARLDALPVGTADDLFILDRDNRPVYGRRGQARVAPSEFADLRGADAVIAEVRRAEAAGATDAVQASRLVVQGGKLRLISATLVQPGRGTARLTQPYAPVLVAYASLDPPQEPLRLAYASIGAVALALLFGGAGALLFRRSGKPRPSSPSTAEPVSPAHDAPFHLADAVRTSAARVAPMARDKALDLILDIDPAAESPVSGDVEALQELLLALLSNAVKFTSDGYVALAVRAEAADRWRIEVQDTGAGFDPVEMAQRLALSRSGSGGLGLASRLTMLMGGEVTAAGAPGIGATFTVRLPLPALQPPAERRLRVLLADQEPASKQALQVLLAGQADLIWAADAEEALRAFATDRFDLVLLDIQLPVIGGVSTLRALREQEQARGNSHTPVVLLSTADRADSLAAGADLHMARPIKPAKLLEVLRAVSERQALADAA